MLAAWGCGAPAGDDGDDGSCGAGMRDCGQCVTVANDPSHCGSCGNACSAGEECSGGACRCRGELEACGEACVELSSDARNCGRCGNVCAQGSVCSNGTCAQGCVSGLARCGTSCVELDVSPLHCGQCNRACAAGQNCAGGSCVCAPDRMACGSACVDASLDAMNCGSCGNRCATGQACVGGICMMAEPGTGGGVSSGGSAGGSGSGGSNAGGGSGASGGNSGSNATGGTAGTSSSGGSAGSNGAGAGGTGGASGSGAGGGSGGRGGSAGGSSNCEATGFHVRDGVLYDVNCNEFVMRGVNYPYTWFASRNTQQDLNAIGATGANSVRLVLSSGGRWTRTPASTLTSLIGWAKAAKLVSVVEVHDTTGYSEQSGSVALSNATSYWTSSDIAAALRGQEAYVIVNVGNEPNGNNTSSSWVSSHVTAVQALRSAGFEHTLMVDAPNWGQDWENTMRDGGGAPIWQADAQKNLVFSVHMYDVYGSSSTVTSYFNTFLSAYEAPLVVGEFAADHGASGNVDEDAIMSAAETLSIGYLGWSWSGNSGDLATLDITNDFNASSLTTWGNRLISGANGIESTSQLCTCFD